MDDVICSNDGYRCSDAAAASCAGAGVGCVLSYLTAKVRYFCNLSNIGGVGQVMLKITLTLTLTPTLTYTRQHRFDGLQKF